MGLALVSLTPKFLRVATADAAAATVVVVVLATAVTGFKHYFPVDNNAPQSKLTSLGLVALVVVVLISMVGGYLYLRGTRPVEQNRQMPNTISSALYTGPQGAYAKLVKTNEHYVKANALASSKDFTGAIAEYKLALTGAQSDAEKSQISFDMAHVTDLSGDPATAIDMYKQIATNETNIPILRAYAIAYMGRMYYASKNPALTDDIFKDEPFASLRVQGDDSLSYRHLFEYSSSLYPLAIPDLLIAAWYANSITTSARSHTSSDIGETLTLIHQKLASADKELTRISLSTSNEIVLTPEVLNDKARLLDKLFGTDPAVTATQVENVYIQTLNAYATTGPSAGSDFYVRLFYAIFIARTSGAARAADIQTILAPVYPDVAHNTSHAKYLANTRSDTTGNRTGMIVLAQKDTSFKKLLLSLGWHETDFSSSTK